MFQFVSCPNCRAKTKAILKENRWVRWIEIYCYGCEYRKNIKNFDFIQPTSPFYKAIYGNDPIELEKRKQREKEKEKNNLKDKREINLKLNKLLKAYEKKEILKYVRESDLEE